MLWLTLCELMFSDNHACRSSPTLQARRKWLPCSCSRLMSYKSAHADAHFGIQITFCVAVKEARTYRNVRPDCCCLQ